MTFECPLVGGKDFVLCCRKMSQWAEDTLVEVQGSWKGVGERLEK